MFSKGGCSPSNVKKNFKYNLQMERFVIKIMYFCTCSFLFFCPLLYDNGLSPWSNVGGYIPHPPGLTPNMSISPPLSRLPFSLPQSPVFFLNILQFSLFFHFRFNSLLSFSSYRFPFVYLHLLSPIPFLSLYLLPFVYLPLLPSLLPPSPFLLPL